MARGSPHASDRPEAAGRRPLIGLSLSRRVRGRHEYAQVRRSYPNAIAAAGGTPLLIPPLDDEAALRQLFSLLDGVVFPGGLDVDPAAYGEQPHPSVEVDPIDDRLELRLAEWAVSSDLPTLGICRGQQLLNVALGGSLVQDLAAAGVPHPQSRERAQLAHPVHVEPGSALAGILGATAFEVNSFHHQAVRELGRGLRAVAWSPDGTIEGLESVEHPWLFAVQFHPEDLVGFHPPSQRLFRALVEAAQARAR